MKNILEESSQQCSLWYLLGYFILVLYIIAHAYFLSTTMGDKRRCRLWRAEKEEEVWRRRGERERERKGGSG